MTLSNPRTIDLFCGPGGSSYGARKAGCQIVAGFDFWPPAVETYRANFPEAQVFDKDIRRLSPEDIKTQIGDIDLILASPECTSHSKAKGAAKRSEESRQSAFQVIRFAQVFQPQWIVLENVVEMQNWDAYPDLLKQLKDMDYDVRPDIILNAKDFGVPQSRERLFILCSRLGMPEGPEPDETPVEKVSNIISKNTYDFSPLRKRKRAKATLAKADHAIENLGKKEPFLIVYYGSGKYGSGGWQRVSEPLRTITTLDRFAYVIPYGRGHRMRMLQPEELKLAMGFDDDFTLDAVEGITRRDRVKLMGNGVCPPVMTALVERLLEQETK